LSLSKGPLALQTLNSKDTSPMPETVSYVRLAQVLNVKVDTVYRWVKSGQIRQPTYFGKVGRWPLEVAQQILAEGTKPRGTYPHVKPKRVIRVVKPRRSAKRTETAQAVPDLTGPDTPVLAGTVKLHRGRKRR
jgi:hypothetical protein